MEQPKRSGGRPSSGARFPRRLMVYESDRGMQLLQSIAERWETTQADAVRRIIREKAKELGLTNGAE